MRKLSKRTFTPKPKWISLTNLKRQIKQNHGTKYDKQEDYFYNMYRKNGGSLTLKQILKSK